MKRKSLAVISITLIVSAVFYFNKIGGNDQQSRVFSHLKELWGYEARFIEGHPIVLHFWAKWCAPCAEEIPHLVEFSKVANEKFPDLRIVAVSLDENIEESKSLLPNKGVGLPSNWLLYLDSEHKVAESMGSYQYPETYFFDAKGAVIEKWVGPQKWDTPEVIEYFTRKLTPNQVK